VLPDFSPNSASRTGYIRSGPNTAIPEDVAPAPKKQNAEEEEQVLYMGNERFAGPELLFRPSDIGRWSHYSRVCVSYSSVLQV
jgi:actin-related protein 6